MLGDLKCTDERPIWPEALRTKWACEILKLCKSGCHFRARLPICLVGKKFVSLPSGKYHEALKFVTPLMSHKALVDAKLVPRIDGGVNTNDAIFEVIWPVSVVTGSNLIQLRKANGLVDCGGPLTVWILVSFCLTTI